MPDKVIVAPIIFFIKRLGNLLTFNKRLKRYHRSSQLCNGRIHQVCYIQISLFTR